MKAPLNPPKSEDLEGGRETTSPRPSDLTLPSPKGEGKKGWRK